MLTYFVRVAHQVLRGIIKPPKVTEGKKVIIPFRCHLIDVDGFFHMNNANYLCNAELSRWRTLPAGKLVSRMLSKEGMLFLAAENNVKYFRPIDPFQRYVISTTVEVCENDKWWYYRHSFEEHPDDVKGQSIPKVFAIVDLKAVVKQKNGKTIKPTELLKDNDFYKNWVTVRETTTDQDLNTQSNSDNSNVQMLN
jgi:acyl-CoA thioesterase FadM